MKLKNPGSATPSSLSREPTITITEREYESIRATAELVQHVDLYRFTLKNRDSKGKVPLEEALN